MNTTRHPIRDAIAAVVTGITLALVVTLAWATGLHADTSSPVQDRSKTTAPHFAYAWDTRVLSVEGAQSTGFDLGWSDGTSTHLPPLADQLDACEPNYSTVAAMTCKTNWRRTYLIIASLRDALAN